MYKFIETLKNALTMAVPAVSWHKRCNPTVWFTNFSSYIQNNIFKLNIQDVLGQGYHNGNDIAGKYNAFQVQIK